MGERLSGILLHPTALPGPDGIGDLGESTAIWLDWLAAAGQRLRQVLPLGPPGYSGSPYDGPSSAAGNPLLISLASLADDGLLPPTSIQPEQPLPSSTVDLGAVRSWKGQRLQEAWRRLQSRGPDDPIRRELESWADSAETAWAADWALFAALRDRFASSWVDWPEDLRDRRPKAIAGAQRELHDQIGFHRFAEFLFQRQWTAVRRRATELGIRILGDLPFYVALDSAEVWCHQSLFDLDPEGRPNHVSGVPPDAYSEHGQLWGHPLYRWDRMRDDGYRWWIERLRQALDQADLVRLDHFRGFAGYWEVAAEDETAAGGTWRTGPGRELFDSAQRELGDLPLVAEDLGSITDDVHELRRELGLPGMRVLQFGLEEGAGDHLPPVWTADLVAYTGTHDSDTSAGWLAALDPETGRRVRGELGGADTDMPWAMIRAVQTSMAETAVIPLQDLLGLGSEARFNTPATADGNWGWRFRRHDLTPELARRLRRLSEISRRAPQSRAGAPGE
jgi:4-alpha-glucanotransferase